MRQQAAFFHSPRMFFCLFIRKVIFSQYNIRRAALSDVLYRLTETNLLHSLGPDKQAAGIGKKSWHRNFLCGGKRKVRVRFLSFCIRCREVLFVTAPHCVTALYFPARADCIVALFVLQLPIS